MKNVFFLLFVAFLVAIGCKNPTENQAATSESAKSAETPKVAAPTETPKTPAPAEKPWIVVPKTGAVLLLDKKVGMENLQAALTEMLYKTALTGNDFPKEIGVSYEGEALMGIRGEIKTIIADAKAGAMKKAMSTTDKPDVMLLNFYSWYIPFVDSHDGNIDKAALKDNTTARFYKEITAKKELVDADYFTLAQDIDPTWVDNLGIETLRSEGDKATMKFAFKGDNKGMNHDVQVAMVKENKSWKIDKVTAVK